MFKQIVLLQIMYSKVKNKNVIGFMKDELGRKAMNNFLALRAKSYSYVIDDGSEEKMQKTHQKRKLKFENYKNCVEGSQLENKVYCLEKNETEFCCLKMHHKELINSNKLILKTQQRFKKGRHNVFTEKLIIFLKFQMMIKEFNQLIRLNIYREQKKMQ